MLKLPAYQNKFGHTVFRAECLVPGNLERVFDMIHPSTQYYRSHWDKIAQSIDVIEEINEVHFDCIKQSCQ